MKLSSILLASALIAAPAYAGSQALNDDQAEFGHCTAYEASEEGRAHGNASQAPPFQALEENASVQNASVEEYCSNVQHPGDEHRPDDAGDQASQHHPEDPGRADEHRPEDPGRPDEAGEADGDHGRP